MTADYRPDFRSSHRRKRRRRRGATIVLVAVCLPIFVVMAAFAVNIAFMELTRAELRTATDAAARAASNTLNATGDEAVAVAAAKDVAAQNLVGSRPLLLKTSEVEFGTAFRGSVSERFSYTPGGDRPNSVRVFGRLSEDSLTGVQKLPFAHIFGQPHFGATQTAVAARVDRDIALVLDRSGSMAFVGGSVPDGWNSGDPAPEGSHWRDLVVAVTEFLQQLDETPLSELVSVNTFASSSVIDLHLTADYEQVNQAMDTYTQSFSGGGTAIGAGMQDAILALTEAGSARSWVAKTMVILTDGNHTTGIHPNEVIGAVNAARITVHTITFGNDADQALMQQLAEQGNGKHWHAPTGSELVEVFREIADNSPTLLVE